MGTCFLNERPKKVREESTNNKTLSNESMNSSKTFKEISKSLCKITTLSKNNQCYGKGFFMYIELNNKTIKCLLTNYNKISQEIIDLKKDIEIVLENGKVTSISLDATKRYIKYLKRPLNITIIEILNIDSINNDVSFLYYDSNYTLGYEQYLNKNISSLNHSMNEKKDLSIGKIININEGWFQNTYNFSDDYTGFPIILDENKKIIGIYEKKNSNNGVFIGEIMNELKKEDNENELKDIELEKKENREKLVEHQLTCAENEISIIYIINDEDKFIQLFGSKFVLNNKTNCKLIINDEEKELCEYLDIKNLVNKKETKTFELKLKYINKFKDISFMYASCKNILSISNISHLDTSNITKMNYLFFGCASLLFIPDISGWNTSNVINMADLFSGCSSITSLPDLSKWDTSKVTDMSYFFS